MACTLLAALFVAIPVRSALQQSRGREWVASQRGHVSFKYELDHATGECQIPYVPQIIVRTFGVDLFNPVTAVALDCEPVETFEPLTDLSTLESLGIIIEISDTIDFAPLKELPHLREIYFADWSWITPKQLNEVRELLPHVAITSDLPEEY